MGFDVEVLVIIIVSSTIIGGAIGVIIALLSKK